MEADLSSMCGVPVLQTQLEYLEMSAVSVCTREIFILFCPVLQRACTCKVICDRKTSSTFKYKVRRYRKEGVEWNVSFSESSLVFKCSCQRFESLGIPCEHVVAVLVFLDIVQLPGTVILKRWTKDAKDSIGMLDEKKSLSHDPLLWCTYVGLVEHSKAMAKEAYKCGRLDIMRKSIELITAHHESLKAIRRGDGVAH